MRTLDLDQLRTFVVVAELKSFTAAGETLGATQSAISLRLARLEESVGRRLLARTPRSVSLTPDGARFLADAHAILTTHDAALARLSDEKQLGRLRLAVSEHAAGGHLPRALAGLRASLPLLVPDVVTGLSVEMRTLYDRGEADAAIVRQDAGHRDGKRLFADRLVWVASPGLGWHGGAPVPLIALRGKCAVKAAAVRAIEAAGLDWRDAFLAGSVSALQAAAQAGLGIAPLSEQHVPPGCLSLRRESGLPPLPSGKVVLLTRLTGPTRRAIEAAFEATTR